MSRVVCFGELLLRLSAPGHELLLQTPRLDACVGGAEANVAVSLACFGHRPAFVSVVADNALGRAATAELAGHGVDVRGVVARPGRMGLYFLTRGALMRPSDVLYDRAGSAFASAPPDAIDWREALAGADWLHVSGITPAVSDNAAAACQRAVDAAAAAGVPISFDGNYRERLWAARDGDPSTLLVPLLERARVAFIDERDVAVILKESFDYLPAEQRARAAAEAAFRRFPLLERILATARSVTATGRQRLVGVSHTRSRELRSRAFSFHEAVDRIGAGDAFAAGALHGLLSGYEEQRMLDFATAAAALKHSILGDFNLVSVEDVQRVLGGGGSGVSR